MDRTGADTREVFPVLVLAAGASRRMGRAKALLPLNSGTLLDHAIGQARHLGALVTVVAGGWYPLVRYRCSVQPSAWVVARDWQDGLAASLRAGVASLGPRAKGVFIVLMDQPLIKPAALATLGAAARSNPAQPFAADLHNKPGAPAYIPRALWSEIMTLKGDRGAAAILAKNGATRITMAGAGLDVDTPGDWQRVRRQLSEQS